MKTERQARKEHLNALDEYADRKLSQAAEDKELDEIRDAVLDRIKRQAEQTGKTNAAAR